MRAQILTYFFIAISFCTSAQFVVDGAFVIVSNDAKIQINGDVKNNGNIFNYGTLALTGNWENMAEYNDVGTFHLIGLDQNIIPSGGYFNKLIIDGDGNKTIDGPLFIKDSLIFVDGIVTPFNNSRITLLEEAGVTGSDEYSFVNGALYQSGTGTKFFPIGTVVNEQPFYRPTELHSIEGESPILGMQYFRILTSGATYIPRISQLSTSGYWSLDIASGSVSSSFLSASYWPTEDLDDIDETLLNIAQADSMQGRYYSTKVDDNYFSDKFGQLEFITTLDTVKRSYFALAETDLVNLDLLYIPNALSSKAPNVEDQAIKVYGDLMSEEDFYFRVENHWGNNVFETNSLELMETVGWTGINQRTEKQEMPGQYTFIISAKLLDGRPYKDAGSIWIID